MLATLARLARPGGVRAVAAESLAVKHQLLIMKRARRGSPNLTVCVANYRFLWKINNSPYTRSSVTTSRGDLIEARRLRNVGVSFEP
jgi:hypothetical protein